MKPAYISEKETPVLSQVKSQKVLCISYQEAGEDSDMGKSLNGWLWGPRVGVRQGQGSGQKSSLLRAASEGISIQSGLEQSQTLGNITTSAHHFWVQDAQMDRASVGVNCSNRVMGIMSKDPG